MLIRNLIPLLIVVFFTQYSFGQNGRELNRTDLSFSGDNNSEISLTGNFQIDKNLSFNAAQQGILKKNLIVESDNKKSPWLGALFSFILPGAGEFYAGDYLKAGIFAAFEAAVITTAVIYNNKGNDQTDMFQTFADRNWSPVRYAKWLNKNRGGNITINEDPSLPPWQQVSFAEINQVESLPQNADLSHNLAPYGEQQYYEMIGKYDQFSSGWDDFNPDQVSTTPISDNFRSYTDMRGKANNYYSVASTAVIGIYINHFLSSIDAYWSTTVYNKELVAKVTVENKRYANIIELIPTLKVKLSF